MAGPLAGLKVVEMAGIGPGPFAAMVLADLGADVVQVARPGATPPVNQDVLYRGRCARLTLDLKQPGAVADLLALIAHADVLLEGFRPGVMEHMGLGPEVCQRRNPRLIYGRMTGWGQSGPLAHAAGHDLDYIALSGALHAIGPAGGKPVIPLNYVGDFGGGAMLLAIGVLAALFERARSGHGQVIDAAMTDGAALLSAMMYGMKAAGEWPRGRGENLLDGGAPFYDTYACADGKYVAVAAIEPRFYAALLARCGLTTDPLFSDQMNRAYWSAMRTRLAEVFRTRTRDGWCALLEGSDACFSPVLDWDEAPRHPHNRARRTFVTVDGVTQPAPAPRFDRTPAAALAPATSRAGTAAQTLTAWGLDDALVGRLLASA